MHPKYEEDFYGWAPVGMFWSWGGWDNLGYFDYLITENMDTLSKITLYENWKKADLRIGGRPYRLPFTSLRSTFHIYFAN